MSSLPSRKEATIFFVQMLPALFFTEDSRSLSHTSFHLTFPRLCHHNLPLKEPIEVIYGVHINSELLFSLMSPYLPFALHFP